MRILKNYLESFMKKCQKRFLTPFPSLWQHVNHLTEKRYSGPRNLDHRLSYTGGPEEGNPWRVSGALNYLKPYPSLREEILGR
jgi:hypothetical protein